MNIHLKIDFNTERLKDILVDHEREFNQLVKETTLKIQNASILSMQGLKSGRFYKVPKTKGKTGSGVIYRASAPGEPPAVRTGRLRASIRAYFPRSFGSNYIGIVAVHAYYGLYLEFGTRRIAPRPFLRPAVDKYKSEFFDRAMAIINQ